MFCRRIALILIAVLVVGALSGTVARPTAAQDKVTLTLMFWGDTTAPDFWKGLTEAFIADGHENVEFEFIHQPDEYETKLQTLIAAGDGPDVFLLNSNQVYRFASEGVLLDQQPYYDAAGTDPKATFVEPALWYYENELVAVASSLHSIILYYNIAAFDEAGLEYPPSSAEEAWTWDEFVQVAKQLSGGEGMNQKWGVYVAPWMTVWTPFVFSNGGTWFNEDYTEFTLNSPEATEALQKMADLRLVDNVAPTLDMAESIGWDVMLQSNRVAMFIDGTWNMPALLSEWGGGWGVAVLPKLKEYKTATFNDPPVVWAETPHPDEAAAFAQFVANPANQLATYQSGNGVPSAIAYLSGDKLQEWLADSGLPANYEQTVVQNVNYSGPMPGKGTALMPQIEWPIVMDYVYQIFRGEKTAVDAMNEAKPKVDEVLRGG